MAVKSQCPECLFINTDNLPVCPMCQYSLSVDEGTETRRISFRSSEDYACDMPTVTVYGEGTKTRPKRNLRDGYLPHCPGCLFINTFCEKICPVCGKELYDESRVIAYQIEEQAAREKRQIKDPQRFVSAAVGTFMALFTLFLYCQALATWGFAYVREINIIGMIMFSAAAIFSVNKYWKSSIPMFVIGSFASLYDAMILCNTGRTVYPFFILMVAEVAFYLPLTYHKCAPGQNRFALSDKWYPTSALMYLVMVGVFFGCLFGGVMVMDNGYSENVNVMMMTVALTPGYFAGALCITGAPLKIDAALIGAACLIGFFAIAFNDVYGYMHTVIPAALAAFLGVTALGAYLGKRKGLKQTGMLQTRKQKRENADIQTIEEE